MKRIWQAIVVLSLAVSPLGGQEVSAPQWEPLKVQASAFSPAVGLLDTERDEYATHLADCALTSLHRDRGGATVAAARRMMELALHLSPRNRRAVVINFQLAKGILPPAAKDGFSPPSLARLLTTRAEILSNTEQAENKLLARMFRAVAAELDPKNEDAVYACQMDELDHGALDWGVLSRPAAKPETVGQKTPPEPEPGQRPPGRPGQRGQRPGN